MSAFAILLVACAAIAEATWNVLFRKIGSGIPALWLTTALSVCFYIPLIVYIVLFEKPSIGRSEWLFICGTGFIHLSYMVMYQAAIRHEDGEASYVYPLIRSFGALFSIVLAIVVFEETPTIQALFGATLILVGVFFLAGGADLLRSDRFGRPFLLAVSAGCIVAALTIWDAVAIKHLMISPLIIDFSSKVLRTIVLVPFAYKQKDRVTALLRVHTHEVIAIAVLAPASYLLILFAILHAPVSYVAPARELGVLAVVLGGWLFLGEKQAKHRLPWAVLIVLGIFLLGS